MTEDDSIETFQKIAGQQYLAQANEQNEYAEEKSFNVQEKSQLDATVVKGLVGGQGFTMINGRISPMLVAFYDPPKCSYFPEFKDFGVTVIGKPRMYREIEKVKETVSSLSSSEEVDEIKNLIRPSAADLNKWKELQEEINNKKMEASKIFEENRYREMDNVIDQEGLNIEEMKERIKKLVNDIDEIVQKIENENKK